ncbi:hypothetical protein CYMTET_42343 [Cymbomonas tetramitiformis]|uniref:Uncharacterized protein n=1 Tax=Cymbomonas tetramitiformis TaxID=36881 RepID=A0AAE0C5E1_9CHLO|nr:hypothetical protein CYMTET_42343 [Cymbomonas tetramitiformis]
MPPEENRRRGGAKAVPERSSIRHNYQSEMFETRFVELKVEAKLSECWFGNNPRSDENDCEAVNVSYAQHGNLRDELAVLWAKLPTARSAHYEHVPKRYNILTANTILDINARTANLGKFSQQKRFFFTF